MDNEPTNLIDNPRAIFGILNLPDNSCFLVIEPSENYNKSIWEKLRNFKNSSKNSNNHAENTNYNLNLKLDDFTIYLKNDMKIHLLKKPIELLQISNDKKTLTTEQDKRIFNLFTQFPIGPGNEFYFSFTESYNLTDSFQGNLDKERKAKERGIIINEKFLWNRNLLKNKIFKNSINYALKWCCQLCHGFLAYNKFKQKNADFTYTNLVILAKRSSKFAGTRFTKRGSDLDGNAANEVEIEQIVKSNFYHDIHVYQADHTCSNFSYSSFVQLRGSVPGLWSQDIFSLSGGEDKIKDTNKMMALSRPKISVTNYGTTFRIGGKHFKQIIERFDKCVVFNLLRDHTGYDASIHVDGPGPTSGPTAPIRDEVIIGKLLNDTVSYLKQFVSEDTLKIVNLDMANENKSVILDKIEDLAEKFLEESGVFCDASSKMGSALVTKQTSIIRSNCLDCLDRTNTAQLIIGQVALSHQLKSLGLLKNRKNITSSYLGATFPQLFESLGDVMAKQYAGSTLVHNLDYYKNPKNSTNRDSSGSLNSGDHLFVKKNSTLTSVNRYYSNTFSDWEKQQVISAFLGLDVKFYKNEEGNELYAHFPFGKCVESYEDDCLLNTDWLGEYLAEEESDRVYYTKEQEEDQSPPQNIQEKSFDDMVKELLHESNDKNLSNLNLKNWSESDVDFKITPLRYVEGTGSFWKSIFFVFSSDFHFLDQIVGQQKNVRLYF